VLLALGSACAASPVATPPPVAVASPTPEHNGHADEVPSPEMRPLPASPAPSPPDPKIVAKAKKLLQRGVTHYSRGEYDKAEEALREAVLLYPFLPEANLVLGKVFLVRGSASRDRTMVSSARLMFEMAYALDPELREAAVLLELFQATAGGDAPPQ
jgi:hypothetical protein